jgi:quinol monooxygenase YgiN
MFEVTARLKVRDGELDGFIRRSAEMMKRTRALDTKTLRYDWFITADGSECEVREGYVDADGLVEHSIHVAEARNSLFHDHAYGHDMTIYGAPSPALADLMERMSGHVGFNRFSLLQSLNSDHTTEGDASMFEATARLTIREGRLDEFKRQAAELMRQMKDFDDPPLRYDWYVSEDGSECEVRETYTDADTLLKYQQQVAEAKMKLFRESVVGHTMTFYGELSPALVQMLTAMDTTYSVFSRLQGLDTDIELRQEVTA